MAVRSRLTTNTNVVLFTITIIYSTILSGVSAAPRMQKFLKTLDPSRMLNKFRTCTVFLVTFPDITDMIVQRAIAQPMVLTSEAMLQKIEYSPTLPHGLIDSRMTAFFGLKYTKCGVVVGTSLEKGAFLFRSMTRMNRRNGNNGVDIHPEFHLFFLPCHQLDNLSLNNLEQHVPIKFFFGFEQRRLVDSSNSELDTMHYQVTQGTYFCTGCNKFRDTTYHHEDFDCHSDETEDTCYDLMMEAFKRVTSHGKNISWATNMYLPLHVHVEGYQLGVESASPFNRLNPMPIAETILSNLFPDSEFLLGQRPREFNFKGSRLPMFFQFVSDEAPDIGLWTEALILDRKPLHYMITSEQIDEALVSVSMFTSPFPLLVWRSLAASVVVTAAILTILLNRVRPCDFLHTLCKLLESLVDQWSLEPRTGRSIRGDLTKLTLLAWLLLSFFFTNLYRTFWSVEFVAPFPLMTKMENLTEFLNFDIYVVAGQSPLVKSCWSKDSGLFNDQWFIRSFLGKYEEFAPSCDLDHEYLPCSFLQRLLKTRILFRRANMDSSVLLSEPHLTQAKTFANMYCNVRVICEEHLLDLIVANRATKAYLPAVYHRHLEDRDYLRKEYKGLCSGLPSVYYDENQLKPCYCDDEIGSGRRPIAFVASEYEFDWLWNKFKLLMKEKKLPNNMRFATTKHHQDMSYIASTGYGITRGLHPMLQRPKTILHRFFDMGIYQLWKKWDWIRFSRYRLRDNQLVPERNADFQALTLLSSHLILVFCGLGMLLAVSMAFFIIEVGWKRIQKVNWKYFGKERPTLSAEQATESNIEPHA